jgi:guanine nucleotide-binding protein G(I)/G(S)/G(T) subunit beta-1
VKNAASGSPAAGKLPIKLRRTLKGHSGKIYSIHWAEDSPLLVSAGQDGVCLVWDTILNCKTNCYPLKCTWVMTCCFAPSSNFIACGGLDNNCSIFNLSSNGTDPVRELEGHQGHLSSCRFLNDAKILTSSGDKTAILWDLESGKQEAEFTDHGGDVMRYDFYIPVYFPPTAPPNHFSIFSSKFGGGDCA